ncbi:hypothetical protein WMY93_002264 [Mugilogobius chulae]|uniref:Ig-like domain-containing protein n=1 Tax=Mugilogobius chulae TaxID=88201 RepID=A0AAW0PUX1_9GOBI
MSDSHTAANINAVFHSVAEEWSLNFNDVVFVTDNAANMLAVAQMEDITHITCFAHSLNCCTACPQTECSSTTHGSADEGLKKYLVVPSEDPLEWWRFYEGNFPLLSRQAKRYLCIPAAEPVFSTVIADNNVGSVEHQVKLEIFQKEDFRGHLKRSEGKAEAAPTEPGRIPFEVVKADKLGDEMQLKEVVMLKKAQRIVHEKETEETEELRSKFKRRTEEGYYESISSVEMKSRKRDDSYEDLLKKTKEDLLHRKNEKEEAEKKKKEEQRKLTAKAKKPERVKLSASMEAPKIQERITSQTVSQGQEVRFRVRVVGRPDPECQWFKNGVQLEKTDRISWFWPEDHVCELVIKDVRAEDSASVMVKAPNKLISFTQQLVDVNAKEKDTMATFEGETNEPFVKVKWLKGEEQVFSGDKYRMHSDRKVHFLSVLTIGMKDETDYSCVLCEDDSVRTTAKLYVEGEPLELLKRLESTEVPENYSAEFECVVSREDAEGSWFFGDNALTPSGKYVMMSRRGRHSLSVKDVKKEDQGKYTFKVGEFSTSASLKMKLRPVTVMAPLADLTVCEGDIAQMEVRFSQENVEGVWLKNGEQMTASDRVHMVVDKTTHKLLIEDTTKTDQATYGFNVPSHDITSSAKLNVQTIDVLTPLKDMSISAQDVSSVKWFHDEVQISGSDRIQTVAKGAKQRLVLNRTHESDQGRYKLLVGRAESTCNLSVQPVQIVSPMQNKECSESENVVFEVEVSHAGIDAFWTFKGQALKAGAKYKMDSKKKLHSLTVMNAMKDEEGQYSFSAGEKSCTRCSDCHRRRDKEALRDLVVADSQTSVLECEVANPASQGQWFKDGHPWTSATTSRVWTKAPSADSSSHHQGHRHRRVLLPGRHVQDGRHAQGSKVRLKLHAGGRVQSGADSRRRPRISVDQKGVELTPSDKYSITTEGAVHTLIIHNCTAHDESVYSFKLGKLSANARLNVETIKILKKPKDVTSLLGGTAVFELGLSEDDIPSNGCLRTLSSIQRLVQDHVGQKESQTHRTRRRQQQRRRIYMCGRTSAGVSAPHCGV